MVAVLRTLDELDVRGKRVLVRTDYNVPLQDGHVTDDARIRASLPTLHYLLERGARPILITHLGRPGGQPVPELRLDPVARRLSELLSRPVRKLDEVVGPSAKRAVQAQGPGEVVMLENVRFHLGETSDDPELAEALARLGERYVNDAFGTAHRAHASTHGVAQRLPSAAGLLLQREVETLGRLLAAPERPYWAMVGGAKLSDKIRVLSDLLPRVDGYLIGGGIAFSLLKAQGFEVGSSLVDEELLPEIEAFLREAEGKGVEIVLPQDVVVAPQRAPGVPTRTVDVEEIPQGQMGLDIGPRTVETFKAKIQEATSLLWAGPLGAFETPPFGEGTLLIARAVAESRGTYAVVGGGDTASALKAAGLAESENLYLSTGGGAALAFLGGRSLPALEVLQASD